MLMNLAGSTEPTRGLHFLPTLYNDGFMLSSRVRTTAISMLAKVVQGSNQDVQFTTALVPRLFRPTP